MSDKKTPKDWADQIAEVSHSLGEGLFGKRKNKKKTYKTPNPTVKRREGENEEPPNIPPNVLVRKGQGTSRTDITT